MFKNYFPFSYFINSHQTLVAVDHSLYLVDKNKVDKQIEWILLSEYQFWTFFMYKFDIYDEETDGIKMFKAIKVG